VHQARSGLQLHPGRAQDSAHSVSLPRSGTSPHATRTANVTTHESELCKFVAQALSFVKSSFVPTLLDKLDPYNTEVYQNFKPSKGKQHQKDPQFVLRCQLGRTPAFFPFFLLGQPSESVS